MILISTAVDRRRKSLVSSFWRGNTVSCFRREQHGVLSIRLPRNGLRQFLEKGVRDACPACEEWLEVLKRNADIAIDLGFNGVFFDQLGYLSRPCCDPSHGHRVPFMNVFAVKADMVRKLAEYIHTRAPGMAFGIEWINDITFQYADFVHNIVGGTRPEQFLELVRYVLPE